ncbi:MAG: monovalent cation/H+ antiporter subunit D family protein [Hyphomonadaceae bacterium]|nr:monovalent cation/H+ antiporter subunit D family protein [Hyphomonadaceae bacterium]
MIESILTYLAPGWAVTHAAPLLVVVPMITATLLVFVPSGRLAWLASILASLASLFFALVLLGLVQADTATWTALSTAGVETNLTEPGLVSYALGGWMPPAGIEFRVDALNAMILLLVAFIGVLASIFSWPTVNAEVRSEKQNLFYAAYLVCLAGLAGVAITGDAFNLFVFLEISSISTYVLVALGAGRDRRALPAAFNYLVMGTIGATFYVIGVGFLFAATGTLNMADYTVMLPELAGNRAVQAGFAFIIIGLGLKAAMWPLHQWLPNAYAYAPSFVTTFLAATATKVALYALIRFLFTVFSPAYSFEMASFEWLIAPLAIAAMVACSFQAVFQTDVRRTLAYSSVAQVGYMLLGVSLATALGVSAGLLHLVNHALMKGGLFMAVAGVVLTYQGTTLRDFAGLGRSAPWTMTAFAICALSLIGVPLTAGFQSKIMLLQAAFDSGWWWAACVIVFSSVLAVIYMGRILEAVFFKAPENPRKVRKEAPMLLLIPLWVMALANLWIGLDASFPYGLAQSAADAVIGAGGGQ